MSGRHQGEGEVRRPAIHQRLFPLAEQGEQYEKHFFNIIERIKNV